MRIWQNLKKRPSYIRLTQWEYWPSKMFYWPMFIYIPWLQLKSANLCFFTAANPGIDTGGIGLESKFETLLKIPESLRPKTILCKQGDLLSQLPQKIKVAQITYPLIAKPDLGYRGFLVTKVTSEEHLIDLLTKYKLDFIIQEFIGDMEEFGVFYIRQPETEKGTITSLTLKEFLQVTGDGRSTVAELMHQKPRALLQLDRLQAASPELLSSIPNNGKKTSLEIIGNHSRGTMFINGREYIDAELTTTFDLISKQIDGFYYGRYDIKCPSLEDLKKGRNIIILELNGTCSEPTHIYDARQTSYFGAIREIASYWKQIYSISKANRKRGVTCQSQIEIGKRFLNLRKYFIEIKQMESL